MVREWLGSRARVRGIVQRRRKELGSVLPADVTRLTSGQVEDVKKTLASRYDRIAQRVGNRIGPIRVCYTSFWSVYEPHREGTSSRERRRQFVHVGKDFTGTGNHKSSARGGVINRRFISADCVNHATVRCLAPNV